MKIKTIYKNILCCLLAMVMLVFSIQGLSQLLCNKNSLQHFGMFYEQEENFDLLFMGSSHMLNAAIPMQLWQEHGISSYNLAYGSCRMAHSYWMLKNALMHTSPKLIVIDCAYLYENNKVGEAGRPNHMLFNTMPMSRTKLEAICDLFDSRSERMRYLFPLTEFHRRWNELSRDDFVVDYALMGQDLHYTTEKATINCAPRDDSAAVDTVSVEYLDMIIKECRALDIDVLLTYIPFQAGEESMNDMAALYSMAESWRLNYIDPYTMLEFLDPDSDYVNSYEDNSHLNYYGAEKFTAFIGRYISENYDLPDHRADPDYTEWHQYYERHLRETEAGFSAAKSE